MGDVYYDRYWEKNGYTNKGKKNVLIREIMTKISHDIVIQELDDLGVI